MPNLIGKTINQRYKVIESLGRGGMAEVYKARDSRLDTTVAIKLIRMEHFSQDILRGVVKRFQNEAKKMAQLSHTKIIRAFLSLLWITCPAAR